MADGQLLLGTVMILVTVIFHVTALIYLASLLGRVSNPLKQKSSRKVHTMILLAFAVLAIIGIHTIEAWGWAALFVSLGEFADIERALYFSVVTSTTLGYGDITLSERWQLLGTFEAMGGLILFGTSTAFLLEIMRRIFSEFALANSD